MSLNRYKPHLFVLPEDDANRQIANSFVLHPNLKARVIQILPPAGGWGKALKALTDVHVPEMRQYPEERIVLLIDFDQQDDRFSFVDSQIPGDLKERTFVLGVQSNPEKLRRNTQKSFEVIGETLAKDCAGNTNELWSHDLLRDNQPELDRLIATVKPFLFEAKD